MKRLFWVMLLLVVPVMASGAAPATGNTYEIEVIVFENRFPDLEGGEFWRPGAAARAPANKDESTAIGEKNPMESQLAAAKAALEKSGRHRVLAHQRWQQSAEAKSVSKPAKLNSAGGELEGSLRFYLSRLLIVELNLALKDAPGAGVSGGGLEENPVYRLTESRRVKISETHYFDHPKFGALVRVSSVKARRSP